MTEAYMSTVWRRGLLLVNRKTRLSTFFSFYCLNVCYNCEETYVRSANWPSSAPPQI